MRDKEGNIIKVGQNAKIVYSDIEYNVAKLMPITGNVLLEMKHYKGWTEEFKNKIIVEE